MLGVEPTVSPAYLLRSRKGILEMLAPVFQYIDLGVPIPSLLLLGFRNRLLLCELGHDWNRCVL